MDQKIEDKIAFIQKVISYIPVLGMMLVFASLPFGFSKFQRISLIIMGVGFVLDLLVSSRWKGWKWSNDKLPFLFCILFFALIPIWHFFENSNPTSSNYYMHCIESRMPFIAYGVIGIIGLNDKFRIRDFTVVLCLSSIVMVIYSFLVFFQAIQWRLYIPEMTYAENISIYVYWAAVKVNAHMTFNMFMNITLVFNAYLWLAKDVKKWVKVLSLVALFFILIAFAVSFGRTGVITMFVIELAVAFYCLWFKVRKERRWMLLILVLVPVVLLPLFPQFSKSVTHDPRRVIWNVCATLIKDSPVYGHGAVKARELLVERGMNDSDFYNGYATIYINDQPIMNKEGFIDMMQMHPHNMYIGTLTEFGVIGLLILLACLFSPLVCFKNCKNKFFFLLFLFAYAFQGVFESLGPHLLPTFFMFELLLWNYATDVNQLKRRD